MGPDVSKNAYEWELGGGKKVARDAQRTISQGNSLGQAPEINFGIILRYLLLGLYRVLIALKFHFLRFAGVGKGKKACPGSRSAWLCWPSISSPKRKSSSLSICGRRWQVYLVNDPPGQTMPAYLTSSASCRVSSTANRPPEPGPPPTSTKLT